MRTTDTFEPRKQTDVIPFTSAVLCCDGRRNPRGKILKNWKINTKTQHPMRVK